jgi:transposase-like protein
MWWFTTRKSGVNAVNLKDLLGLGSYNTAWRWLQKLRSCTIRKGREKLSGHVEVDEFYLGGERSGKRGRGAEHKCVVAVAVERKGRKLGRLRLQIIDTCSANNLIPFIQANIAPESTIHTDGWAGYNGLATMGYTHKPMLQTKTEDKNSVLPGVHLVTSLIKRLILGTFQGRFEEKYLTRYLDEYVFRFNRRTTKSVGKRFWRFVQQLAVSKPITNTQVATAVISPLLAN